MSLAENLQALISESEGVRSEERMAVVGLQRTLRPKRKLSSSLSIELLQMAFVLRYWFQSGKRG